MASANAIARIDCTMILVDAPGLRPTATAAAAPMRTTASAEPIAASPARILPVISIRPFEIASVRPNAVPLSGRGGCRLIVLADEEGKHGGEQHEHQRLHQPHQQLEKVER